MQEINSALLTVIYVSGTIAAILLLLSIKQQRSAAKILTTYVVFSALLEIIANFVFGQGKNNLILLHIYTFFEFLLLGLFFIKTIFRKSRINGKYFIVSGLLLIVLNSIFLQQVTTYNSYSSTFVSLFTLICCLAYFIANLGNLELDEQDRLEKSLLIAIFLFHSVQILFVIFGNLLIHLSTDGKYLIHLVRRAIITISRSIMAFAAVRYTLLVYHQQKSIS